MEQVNGQWSWGNCAAGGGMRVIHSGLAVVSCVVGNMNG